MLRPPTINADITWAKSISLTCLKGSDNNTCSSPSNKAYKKQDTPFNKHNSKKKTKRLMGPKINRD